MTTPTPDQVFASNCTSFALKDALREALDRDPVDAYHDALLLSRILKVRMDAILPPAGSSALDHEALLITARGIIEE